MATAHAARDPAVRAQAAAFASNAGLGGVMGLGGGGMAGAKRERQQQRQQQRRSKTVQGEGGGGGGASAQGGAGGGGRGGWVHVSDARAPPDWGRMYVV